MSNRYKLLPDTMPIEYRKKMHHADAGVRYSLADNRRRFGGSVNHVKSAIF